MLRLWTALAGCVALAFFLAGCGSPKKPGPASGRIAFVSSRSGSVDLYVMNPDGQGQRPLTHGDAVGHLSDFLPLFAAPSWAPDGNSIAFERDDPAASGSDVWVVRVDGTHRRVLVRNASFPSWSPKGDLIAFTREGGVSADLWVIRPDGTGLRMLVRGAAFSTWSPDGSRIAYVQFEKGKGADIYTVNLGGSDKRRVTHAEGHDFMPAWSTTDRIAFVRSTDHGEDIYVVDADGANEQQLTRERAAEFSPAWSPDGTLLAFSSNMTFTKDWRNGEEIFVVNADGSGRRRLTHNKVRDVAPAWEPSRR